MDERTGAVIAVVDRKPEVRRIKIKSLSPDKNMAQLANDIVEKCKYIHHSRVEEIEQLLIKLRKHHQANAAANDNAPAANNNRAPAVADDRDRGDDRDRDGYRRSDSRGRTRGDGNGNSSNTRDYRDGRGGGSDYRDDGYDGGRPKKSNRSSTPVEDNLPPADINQLDDYLEMLYQVSTTNSSRVSSSHCVYTSVTCQSNCIVF
jgi:hypothetical protein